MNTHGFGNTFIGSDKGLLELYGHINANDMSEMLNSGAIYRIRMIKEDLADAIITNNLSSNTLINTQLTEMGKDAKDIEDFVHRQTSWTSDNYGELTKRYDLFVATYKHLNSY